MLETIREVFDLVVEYIIVLIEIYGAGLLTYVAIQGVKNMYQKNPDTKLVLGEGIATALEFVMIAEVLKTIISGSTDMQELAILGMIILFRVILTFLIHWEIKEESKGKKE